MVAFYTSFLPQGFLEASAVCGVPSCAPQCEEPEVAPRWAAGGQGNSWGILVGYNYVYIYHIYLHIYIYIICISYIYIILYHIYIYHIYISTYMRYINTYIYIYLYLHI